MIENPQEFWILMNKYINFIRAFSPNLIHHCLTDMKQFCKEAQVGFTLMTQVFIFCQFY